MKILIKMEDGKPIIFFPDQIDRDKSIACWTAAGEHATASRAYMRSLKAPETKHDIVAAWQTLARYAAHAAYCESL